MNYMNTSDQNLDYYVKIFDSPRSRVLPEALSAEVVDLANINRTLFEIYKKRNLITLWNKLMTVRSSSVWIEYSGNPFANVIMCLILYINRNSITLDCHNSAIENTSGKLLYAGNKVKHPIVSASLIVLLTQSCNAQLNKTVLSASRL